MTQFWFDSESGLAEGVGRSKQVAVGLGRGVWQWLQQWLAGLAAIYNPSGLEICTLCDQS